MESSSSQLTVNEYLTEREMSALPALLVEGDDDSIAFQLIRDEILRATVHSSLHDLLENVEIDTADLILSPEEETLGNREKVELVCQSAEQEPFSGNLVGFVDREFREFDIQGNVTDLLVNHNQVGRIIWSRGHSMENYLFDYSILRDALREYGVNPQFSINDALDLFERNFSQVLECAAAVSIAAKKTGMLGVAPRTFDRTICNFENDILTLDLAQWDSLMKTRQELDEQRRSKIIEEYQKSLIIVEATEPSVIRWMCHGHIGISFIWITFVACLYQIGSNEQVPSVDRVISHPRPEDRLKRFLGTWVREQLIPSADPFNSPLMCFHYLSSQASS